MEEDDIFSQSQSDCCIVNNIIKVGTVFLWMYWPSFNGGAAATGDAQQRALLNTYYSLCSCVISTVVLSWLLNPERKLSIEHVQNATLAGGVVVGGTADMMLTPGGAVVVGALAGVVSTLGFRYVQVELYYPAPGPIISTSSHSSSRS